ncbi:MAG TPA: hypothetical protein V6D34_03310 [Candidatus Sericytochromatia bacterium]
MLDARQRMLCSRDRGQARPLRGLVEARCLTQTRSRIEKESPTYNKAPEVRPAVEAA